MTAVAVGRTGAIILFLSFIAHSASAQVRVGGSGTPSPTGPGTITGRVISAETGQPLRRASIRATSPALTARPPVVTDEDGGFAFTDLPRGRYSLTASKEGYLSHDADISPVNARYFAAQRPDSSGAFTVKLAAGRYQVAALQSYDASTLASPDVLESIRGTSIPLTISDGEARTLDLVVQQE